MKKSGIAMKKLLNEYKYFLVPCVAVLAIYARGLTGGFALDDRTFFLDNDILPSLHPWDIKTVFLSVSNYWGEHAPIRDYLYVLEYSLFGTSTPGYHVFSLLLYLATGAVLFLFLSDLYEGNDRRESSGEQGKENSLAVLSVITFFLVNPLHVESVANITGQKDLLYALFSFSALALFYRSMRSRTFHRRRTIALFLLFYYCSFLAKDSAVSTALFIPFVWLLFFRQKKDSLVRAGLFWLLVNIPPLLWLLHSIRLRSLYSGGVAVNAFSLAILPERIVRGVTLLGAHTLLVIKPYPLNFGYPFDDTRGGFELAVGSAILFLCCTLIAYLWNRNKIAVLGAGLFLIYFLPYLQLFSTAAFVYDRYLYAALLGAAILCERLLTIISGGMQRTRRSVIAGFSGMMLLMASIAYSYVPLYDSDVAMTRNAYALFPDWPTSAFDHVYSLIEAGQHEAALKIVREERSLASPDWVGDYFRGWIAVERGRPGEALPVLRRARLSCLTGGFYPYPDIPLGRALLQVGGCAEARSVLIEASRVSNYQPLESYRAKKLLEQAAFCRPGEGGIQAPRE